MSEETEILDLAKRFFACAEKGDVDGLMACYAPDAVIWHNHDGLEQTVAETREFFTGFVKLVADLVMTERRLHAFRGGFVQQHVVTGVRKDGVRLAVPSCIVAEVAGGRITRLDEYFDWPSISRFREIV